MHLQDYETKSTLEGARHRIGAQSHTNRGTPLNIPARPEEKREHAGGEEGLDNEPGGTEDGL